MRHCARSCCRRRCSVRSIRRVRSSPSTSSTSTVRRWARCPTSRRHSRWRSRRNRRSRHPASLLRCIASAMIGALCIRSFDVANCHPRVPFARRCVRRGLLGCGGALAQTAPPAAPAAAPADPVVAKVNGQPIHLSDLKDAVQSLPENLRGAAAADAVSDAAGSVDRRRARWWRRRARAGWTRIRRCSARWRRRRTGRWRTRC